MNFELLTLENVSASTTPRKAADVSTMTIRTGVRAGGATYQKGNYGR